MKCRNYSHINVSSRVKDRMLILKFNIVRSIHVPGVEKKVVFSKAKNCRPTHLSTER